MPAYAVFEPPTRKRGTADHTDRYIFLREKFSLPAFLFGPLWMLWRRMWLALIVYVVVIGLAEYVLRLIGIGWPTRLTVYVLIQLLVGIEASGLRRWSLVRRGWRDRGVVVADELELAERRFFEAESARKRASNPLVFPTDPLPTGLPPVRPDVIGLFPEPGGGARGGP